MQEKIYTCTGEKRGVVHMAKYKFESTEHELFRKTLRKF